VQQEETEAFQGRPFRCRGHAWSRGAEEAEHESAAEPLDHEPGMGDAGMEMEFARIK
jgi:hypothetical protein